MRSGSPKPVRAATRSIGSKLLSSRSRDASSRRRSIAFAGVIPVSAAKARAKWRGLIAARSASRSTGQALVEPLARPGEQRREPAAGAVGFEQRRELRLPARPTVIDHELLRGALGDGLAQILGDERQRQVDSGGDAGRGPHRAVADEDAVGLDADLRIGAGELGGAPPMGGGATTIEQSGRGKDESARSRRWRSAAPGPRRRGQRPRSRRRRRHRACPSRRRRSACRAAHRRRPRRSPVFPRS